LPSNLRPTTRECVYLVTRAHFRSCDKDGGHTIPSAIAETSCYTQISWLYILQNRSHCWVKTARIGIFNSFAPVTLTLTRWPSYTYLTCIPIQRYTAYEKMWTSCVKAFESYRLRDRQTDTTKISLIHIIRRSIHIRSTILVTMRDRLYGISATNAQRQKDCLSIDGRPPVIHRKLVAHKNTQKTNLNKLNQHATFAPVTLTRWPSDTNVTWKSWWRSLTAYQNRSF